MNHTVTLLHPGAMGTAVGLLFHNSGHTVRWVSRHRSAATHERATRAGFVPFPQLDAALDGSTMVVSVCPPASAVDVANQVASLGFSGTYVDANAISPQRTHQIGGIVEACGATFVDGGIVGVPPQNRGESCLYLSGPGAAELAASFHGGPLDVSAVSDRIGDASALKMCYAAYTKGSTALLAAIAAAATAYGVNDALMQRWHGEGSGLDASVVRRLQNAPRKAWRFEGEMHEIADTFAAVNQPEGFHRAAAEVYRRIALLGQPTDATPAADVLRALQHPESLETV